LLSVTAVSRIMLVGRLPLTNERAIVKHHNSLGAPLDASLEIMPRYHMLEQELQKQVRLGVLQAHNASDEFQIEEKTLFFSNGMNSDQRMYRVNRILAVQTTGGFSVVDHLGRRVDCIEFIE